MRKVVFTKSFVNLFARITDATGDTLIAIAVSTDGPIVDIGGTTVEGFDPLTTECYSRGAVQSAMLRSRKVGKANYFDFTIVADQLRKAGDKPLTLAAGMTGDKVFGVVKGRETEAAVLWTAVSDAYELENEVAVAA